RIPQAVRTYARDAAGAFALAPVEVLLGLFVALSFSIALRQTDGMDEWARIATSAALALLLVFGLSVLHARGAIGGNARAAGTALVLAAAGLYGWLVVDPDRETEAWRFAALLGAAAMALSLVPVPGVDDREGRRREFWRFNALLLARIASVVAYGVALFAALAGAVAAVSSLFELDTPEHLYQDLFGAVFFALVPWVVAGGIPELTPEPAGEGRAPRAVRLLGRYLYAPVLLVYLAILVAYAVKVVATGEMPKNLLSPIILLAGIGGFLGSLFLEPLRRDPEHAGVARLVRVFPAVLLALLPLATWAVWVRRDQYGWTESRYLRFALLLALGVLAAAGVYRLARRREPVLLLVPVVLGATFLLSAVGPWGASATSRRSQEVRLRQGLAQAGLLRGGRFAGTLRTPDDASVPDPADTDRTIPAELHGQITGAVSYLFDSHGPASLRRVFAGDLTRYQGGYQVAGALPIRPGCEGDEEMESIQAALAEGTPIPGVAGGTLYRVMRTGREDGPEQRSGPVQLQLAGTELRVHSVGAERWTARVDLRALVARLTSTGPEECGPGARFSSAEILPAEAVRTLTDETGRVRGQLVLTNVDAARPEARPGGARGPFRLESVSCLVLVRE
ncbi:MAG TPA: DUF4153 domain-containing protein, partial [Longimicrobiaceae bacterium]|nr:DUF4153 domain-containing protein [Longimicrobiaceae bacterium]